MPKTKRRKKTVQTDLIAQRRIEVGRLRLEGQTIREIAKALVPEVSIATVHSDLEALRATWTDEQRKLIGPTVREELATLERAQEVAIRVLERLDSEAQRGTSVQDAAGNTVAVIVTDDVRLKAIDRLTRIQERRSKLLGLDAPTKVQDVTKNPLQELIKRLAAEEVAGGV